MGLLFRFVLGGVQNRENADAASVNSVGNNVWCTRHNEFARSGFVAGTSEVGMLGKPFYRLKNPLS